MKYFRNFDKEHLLHRIAGIRKKGRDRLALLLHASCLSHTPAARGADMVLTQLQVAEYTEALEVYRLPNHDMVIIAVSTVAPHTLLRDICHILADDPLAQTPHTETGNALCSLYRTPDELLEFHTQLVGMLSSNAPPARARHDGNIEVKKFLAAARERSGRPQPCVLVVEDQRFSRQLVMEILGRRFEVLSAEDGFEALALYEAHAPDIVFLDIDLPGINGREVLRRICAVDGSAFIIMLTASNTMEDVRDSLSHGAQGYIVKPFTQQKIAQYLDLFRQRRPLRGNRAS